MKTNRLVAARATIVHDLQGALVPLLVFQGDAAFGVVDAADLGDDGHHVAGHATRHARNVRGAAAGLGVKRVGVLAGAGHQQGGADRDQQQLIE